MTNQRIALTCKHLQRDADEYRADLEARGFEVAIPAIAGQQLDGDELVAAMQEVAGVIAGDDGFSAEVLAQLPDLRVISKWGIGLDGIDLAAAAERNIVVTNTPGMFNDEVAEMALGYLISLVRGIVATDRSIRTGGWPNPVGRSLSALRVGVVGLGNIGLEFAKKASLLGMPVVGFDPGETAQSNATATGIAHSDLESVTASSDIVVLTCPLNDATRGLFDAERIASMQPGSYLINVGRGPVVHTSAVAHALDSGHLAGAALDVFDEEPLPENSPLRSSPNCIFGSHNSSNTVEACHRTHRAAIDNLVTNLAS